MLNSYFKPLRVAILLLTGYVGVGLVAFAKSTPCFSNKTVCKAHYQSSQTSQNQASVPDSETSPTPGSSQSKAKYLVVGDRVADSAVGLALNMANQSDLPGITQTFSSKVAGKNQGGSGSFAFPASVWYTPIQLSAQSPAPLPVSAPNTVSQASQPTSETVSTSQSSDSSSATQVLQSSTPQKLGAFSFSGNSLGFDQSDFQTDLEPNFFELDFIDGAYAGCGVTVVPEGGENWACHPIGQLF